MLPSLLLCAITDKSQNIFYTAHSLSRKQYDGSSQYSTEPLQYIKDRKLGQCPTDVHHEQVVAVREWINVWMSVNLKPPS